MESIERKILHSKVVLTEPEVCKLLGVSQTTIWRARRSGLLPHCLIGDKVLYLPRHVDEFLQNCERLAQDRAKVKVEKTMTQRD